MITIIASFVRCPECQGSGRFPCNADDATLEQVRCVCGGSGFFPDDTSRGTALLARYRQHAAERPAFVDGISNR